MGLWEFKIKEKVSKILDALLGNHVKINCVSLETHLRNQLGHDAGALNIKNKPPAGSSARSEAQGERLVP